MNTFEIRPNYLDLAKVIGIYSVLVGHFVYFYDIPFVANSPLWSTAHFVTLYHMPLFFIISGILQNYKFPNIKKYLIKLCKTLLVPYLLLSLLIGVPYYALVGGGDLKVIIKFLIGIFAGGDLMGKTDIFPVGPIWFVYSLFFIKLIFGFISENKYICPFKHILAAFICCIGIVLMFINKNILPFRIDSTIVGFIFFSMGYYVKKLIPQLLKSKVSSLCLLAIGIVGLIVLNHLMIDNTIRQGLSINVNYFGNNPLLFLVSGLLGTLTIFAFSRLVIRHLKSSILLTLSNGMIVTLATHKIVFIILSHVLYLDSISGMYIISTVVLFITYLAILAVSKWTPILLGYRK